MQNKLYIIVFLLLVGFTVQAQITDEPIDGGGGNTRYYFDSDGDGHGDPNSNWLSSPADRYVPNNTDCNDNDPSIYLNAIEICDGKDNNCDGSIDESPAPGIPSVPTSIIVNCGSTRITRGNPPNGITWYWQSSTSGKDTSNTAVTHTVFSGSSVYLRARNNNTQCWGTARKINYTIKENPETPSMPTIVKNCGNTEITRGNPPSGVTWYWQTTPAGISTANSSSIYTATNGSRIYLKARNNANGCWSATRYVDYSINYIPTVPPAPSASENCGSTILTRSNPPSGITWYWQLSSTGTGISNSSKTYTATSGSVIYLRARKNTTGCWSTTRTANYNVNYIPSLPAEVSEANYCGETRLSRLHPPDGITWYWQSSESGTSTSNSSVSITRTSGSVYYLRARNNSSGCWGDSRIVNYSIKIIPVEPTIHSTTNNCRNTVLRRNTPPNPSTIWYWQSTESGTSIANQSETITLESGSVYYLRAFHKTGCWSDAIRVNYSIDNVPVPTTPTITNNCGDTELTRGNPPNGITWYWQSSESGESTLNSSVSITRNEGSVYYLKGRNNSSGCWGDAKDVNYSINQPVLWYVDIDGDGYGDPNAPTLLQCAQPAGYVLDNTDQCPNDFSLQQGCLPTSDELSLSNENYVFSRLFQDEMSSPNQIDASDDVIESVTYFDGLGRAMQQIAIQGTPNQHDIVTHMEYDALGRQAKSYLPFSSNTPVGSYKTVDITNDINTYYKSKYPNDFTGVSAASTDFNAYSESIFEDSPLNRVVEQGAPGTAWKANHNSDTDHTIKFDWKSNTTDEVVRFDVTFKYNNTEIPELIKNENNYAVNELYVTITKDENWKSTDGNNHTTREYKDKQGRVILKRTYASVGLASSVAHDTYYVYDRFGNLSFVIPPKVNVADGVSDEELAELCYQYRYDKRNRLIIKRTPGKGEEYIVYNNLDQPVLTQDANQRKVNSGKPYDYWLLTKYDAHGRVAYTGRIANSSNRNILQSRTQSASYKQYESKSTTPFTVYGVDVHYTKAAYPTSIQNIYTMNYYDTYDFDIVGLVNPGTVYGETISNRTRSLPTGTKVRVLDTDDWITMVMYYDSKGRPIYVASKNEYLNTIDIVETKLDFAGKVIETKTTHTKGSNAPIVTIDTFTYDHMGRMLTQVQKINDQAEEQIVSNTYDALGQLESKKVGGASTPLSASEGGLQTVDYTYNVRGWLQQINNPDDLGSDLFAFGINYNTTTENLSAEKLYNGNISETIWKTANDNTKRAYGYQYDALNRIKSGTSNDGNYNLSQVSYDKVGNIVSLDRKGHINEGATSFGNMDLLSYTYDAGNKLLKVTDTSNNTYGFKDGINTNDDFEYDVNGNMILDRNKGITGITYNHLNLPKTVSISNAQGTGTISYIYDATGAKLKKIATEGSSLTETEYAGNYVYKNGVLEFFNHAEGYVEKEADGYKYVYQYKDHLGNIRLSYKDVSTTSTPQLEIQEEKNYYPFGLTHKGYNNTITGRKHPYGYNGKEEQDELGLAWLDFGARNFDPALGRFMNMDRYSETFMPISPYQYGANNPILYLDYNGDYITIGIEDDDGNKYSVLYENGKTYHYSKDSDGNITKGEQYDGKDNGFLNQAVSDLNRVGDTKQGGKMIGKLQESSTGYSISDSGNALDNSFNPNTNSISYSQDDAGRHDGVRFNKSHIKLGHELAHAYDADRGFDMGSIALGGLPASEINAVRFENYLRAQDGETDMRLNYRFGGVNYGLSGALGGKSASYFNSYIAPLGRNEVYKRITPVPEFNPSIDNTYVRKPSIRRVYDTKKQKFVSFD